MIDQFNLKQSKYLTGLIATGDQFIRSKESADKIKLERQGVLAVEMEGAAVAQVCMDYGCPFVVIRVISDGANNDSSTDFPLFLTKVASKYSRFLIELLFKYERDTLLSQDPSTICID